jgi:methionyl-tRNA formyltransferase
MRVVILTRVRRGMASLALPAILRAGHDVPAIVFAMGQPQRLLTRIERLVRKTARIGPLGAINGIRIRPWFSTEPADRLGIEDIAIVAARHHVPIHETPGTNTAQTIDIVQRAQCTLGLSLGNSYISKRVFSIPSSGMINIHHELLPDYPGAQSVLWQIHDGHTVSGYTVHQVREHIDKGEILYREAIPISFESTLQQTVAKNCATLFQKSVDGLLRVLNDYPALIATAEAQPTSNRNFTTPTWREFRTMLREHRRLLRSAASEVGDHPRDHDQHRRDGHHQASRIDQ